MGEVQTSGKNEFGLMNLNSTTEKISKTLGKIKDDFVYIGFLLWEVREYKFYESKGYESVVDYAEKELGFKKTSTYNFIAVCEKFSRKKDNGNPTMSLDDKFKDFSFCQLVEIKTLPAEQLQSFNSDMSNREIREKKKELKSEKVIDVNFVPVEKVKSKSKEVDTFKVVDSMIENIQLKDQVKQLEEERNNQSIDIQKLKKENLKLKSEKKDLLKDPVQDSLNYKDNVIKYLTERLEVMKGLVKDQKKSNPNSNDYFEYLGAFHEVKLLLDCINKDEL